MGSRSELRTKENACQSSGFSEDSGAFKAPTRATRYCSNSLTRLLHPRGVDFRISPHWQAVSSAAKIVAVHHRQAVGTVTVSSGTWTPAHRKDVKHWRDQPATVTSTRTSANSMASLVGRSSRRGAEGWRSSTVTGGDETSSEKDSPRVSYGSKSPVQALRLKSDVS